MTVRTNVQKKLNEVTTISPTKNRIETKEQKLPTLDKLTCAQGAGFHYDGTRPAEKIAG